MSGERKCQMCAASRPYIIWVRGNDERRLCGRCYDRVCSSPEYAKHISELYRRRSPVAPAVRRV